MRAWYIPSSTGDFRLEQHADDALKCLLTVEDPTPDELKKLGNFLAKARQRKWIDKALGISGTGRTELVVDTTIAKAGPILAGSAMPGRGTLTAVRSEKGTLMCVADETEPEAVEEAVSDEAKDKDKDKPKAEVATTVRRPTTCCPNPIAVEGPLKRSSRVLREFCTPSQWRSWVSDGVLYCLGGMTGIRYRICHREHPLAAEQGKICRDVEHGVTLHFWDWSIPPAEEVLAVKLMLENRESWLRNEATYFGRGPKFKNPLGMFLDGTWDASFYRQVGAALGVSLVPRFSSFPVVELHPLNSEDA